MIELNFTLVIQLINFLITLVVLNWLLVAPIRKIIRERKQKQETLSADVDSFVSEGQKLLDGYEVELAKARANASQYRKEVKAKAEAEEQEILLAAGKDAQANLQAIHARALDEAEAARKILQGDMKVFTNAALAKILG